MRLQLLLAAGLALLVSACNAAGTSQGVPPTYAGGGGADAGTNARLQPAVDTTSVLKTLTKQSVVGSTVDPTNGDQNPHGLIYVRNKPLGSGVLKKGDVVVCNYSDSGGVAGNGTTVEYMPSTPGSTPKRLIQKSSLQGCAGLVLSYELYAADSVAKTVVGITGKGKINATLTNKSLVEPWSVGYIDGYGYPPGDAILVADPSSGTLFRIDLQTYQNPPPVTPIITGFPTNKGKAGSMLGPSGVQYDSKAKTLYVADGMNNAIYAFKNVYVELDSKNAIVIGSGGKFSGPKAKYAKVLFSGKPLNAPASMALMANGNLIAGNSAGPNTLVEICTNGKALATKTVVKGTAGAIFGIAASGTSDATTQLYFNDDLDNSVHVLTK